MEATAWHNFIKIMLRVIRAFHVWSQRLACRLRHQLAHLQSFFRCYRHSLKRVDELMSPETRALCEWPADGASLYQRISSVRFQSKIPYVSSLCSMPCQQRYNVIFIAGASSSVPVQGGCILRPVKNRGGRKSTGVVFFHHTFTQSSLAGSLLQSNDCGGDWWLYVPKDLVYPQKLCQATQGFAFAWKQKPVIQYRYQGTFSILISPLC